MPTGATATEQERAMNLAENQSAGQRTEKSAAAPTQKHFINFGEAALLLAFTGCVEAIQLILDFIPFLGWLVNTVIAFLMGLVFFIWLNGKISKGAPKKWYKAIYGGAAGSIIPIIPGYFGAIIYLLIQDRNIPGLKKIK